MTRVRSEVICVARIRADTNGGAVVGGQICFISV
jgi:hypothetical protein